MSSGIYLYARILLGEKEMREEVENEEIEMNSNANEWLCPEDQALFERLTPEQQSKLLLETASSDDQPTAVGTQLAAMFDMRPASQHSQPAPGFNWTAARMTPPPSAVA